MKSFKQYITEVSAKLQNAVAKKRGEQAGVIDAKTNVAKDPEKVWDVKGKDPHRKIRRAVAQHAGVPRKERDNTDHPLLGDENVGLQRHRKDTGGKTPAQRKTRNTMMKGWRKAFKRQIDTQ